MWTERYVRADAGGTGDGTADNSSDAWTLAQAIAAIGDTEAGYRINIRSGTYATTTTGASFAGTGTSTAPIWWRGFNTTPGDLDEDMESLDRPLITATTGGIALNTTFGLWTGLHFESGRTGANTCVSMGSSDTNRECRNCVFHGTDTSATAPVFGVGNANRSRFIRCTFVSESASRAQVVLANQGTGSSYFGGCWFDAPSSVDLCLTVATSTVVGCVCYNGGIRIEGTGGTYEYNTVYNAASDGIENTSAITSTLKVIANNIISTVGGHGINHTAGATSVMLVVNNNSFHEVTGNEVEGLADMPVFFNVTESTSPFVAASDRDMRLTSGAEAVGNASPIQFAGSSLLESL